jgi:hypothetical protein
MKVYKVRLRDESADIVFAYVLADTIEEAEVKARWQYPNYTAEVIGIVAYKEDEESENEEYTY